MQLETETIMTDKLHIEELRNTLKENVEISIQEIAEFYRKFTPETPISTIRWRIHTLVERGILRNVGRGRYLLGKKNTFVPNVYHRTEVVADMMRKEFPLVAYCQWDMALVNAFAQHLMNYQVFFVDVERDAAEAVYYRIRERFRRTYLLRNINEELKEYNDCIIVRNLTTGTPTVDVEGKRMASLEKILVDLAVDKIFPFQNTEIYHIFENSLEAYDINTSKMLRYAARRGRRKEIEEILNGIEL